MNFAIDGNMPFSFIDKEEYSPQQQQQHQQSSHQHPHHQQLLQVPAWLDNPTLALGGGAEAFPSSRNLEAGGTWLSQTGFSPFSPSIYLSDGTRHVSPSTASIHSADTITPVDILSAQPIPLPPQVPRPAAGFPLYSSTGFDLLSLLSRIAHRPNPMVPLGPVDMSCAFLVSDVRRYDAPIVYASPSFTRLTGYIESEIIGKNCRFLQAPDGMVQRGEIRKYTPHSSVRHMKKCLSQNKECQATLINFKKDGSAFINHVTVVPVPSADGSDDVAYHVGFQVDLNDQPNVILQKLRDGSYVLNHQSGRSLLQPSVGSGMPGLGGRRSSVCTTVAAPSLKTLLSTPSFRSSFPAHPAPLAPAPAPSSTPASDAKPVEDYHPSLLASLLLTASPDPIIVLSLKGVFLYAAPGIERLLGYPSHSLAGKSVSYICHAADEVPVMRELKDASSSNAVREEAIESNGTGAGGENEEKKPFTSGLVPFAPPPSRNVDLLFRARVAGSKMEYRWIEARGRLHAEPGKGRKAVVLSARLRPQLASLRWGEITEGIARRGEDEFWVCVEDKGGGREVGRGVVTSAGGEGGIKELLGGSEKELVGRSFGEAVLAPGSSVSNENCEVVLRTGVGAMLTRHDGGLIHVVRLGATIFRPASSGLINSSTYPSSRPLLPRTADADGEPDGPGGEEVLKELASEKDTSWIYEAQSLRSENERLREDVRTLEEDAGIPSSSSSSSSSSTQDPHAKRSQESAGRGMSIDVDGNAGFDFYRYGGSTANATTSSHHQQQLQLQSSQVPGLQPIQLPDIPQHMRFPPIAPLQPTKRVSPHSLNIARSYASSYHDDGVDHARRWSAPDGSNEDMAPSSGSMHQTLLSPLRGSAPDVMYGSTHASGRSPTMPTFSGSSSSDVRNGGTGNAALMHGDALWASRLALFDGTRGMKRGRDD